MEKSYRSLDLLKEGTFTQFIAGCLTGQFKKKIQKFLVQLVEANVTHFIASCVNNTLIRKFHMRESVVAIDKKFGSRAVFFQKNANLLVQGQTVYKQDPV
ncbi:hypothetical protein C1N61_05570 [Priestia aryabhattai]